MSASRGRSSALSSPEPAEQTGIFVADSGISVEKGKPIHLTDTQFETLIKTEKRPVLVDFWAAWCAPCRTLAPTIDDLAREYADTAVIAKLDTQKNRATPTRYRIQGIPTILIFQDGELKETIVGLRPKAVYQAVLNKLISRAATSEI
ncbi:thioredoxin [bacterium]|nr:thioredoxin [candidate division CSSED10-310 bacterium]